MCLISIAAYAKDLGTFGATYSIVEKDFMKEIVQSAQQADWKRFVNKNKFASSVRNFKPKDIKKLYQAEKDRVFTVDLTYSLEFDITDGKGNILYPKGYNFNPLDYVNYHKTLIVINGANTRQLAWFTASEYAKDINVMLLITDGSYYDIASKYKRPVYYATRDILEKFNITAVPSIVKQRGNMMEVREVAVNKKG